MFRFVLAGLAASAAHANTYFKEEFGSDYEDRWTASTWKSEMGVFDHSAGEWWVDEDAQKGIRTTQDMRHHAISAKMDEAVSTKDKTLVVQFSVKHEKREYSFCGGGYIKLLPTMDPAKFGGDTDYAVMFGPDMCGYDVSKIHTIFNYEGKNLEKTDEIKLDYADKNEYTHVYTLVLEPNGEYKVLFDLKEKSSGKIEDHWDFPKKQIDDPTDKKPSDWVDEAEIPDPEDTKPEGWDDIPESIPDPEAEKPEDWSDEDDGEWEPPMIDNPEYKGEWKQKMMPNPDYKGEWAPKQIDNDKYAPETYAKYEDLTHVGFELWTVNSGSVFDNIYVGDSLDEAKEFAETTWKSVVGDDLQAEKDAKKAFDDAKKAAEEAEKEDDEEDEDEDEEEEDEEDDKDEL